MRKVADDAPLIERVEYVIQTQINPQLASHGGKITLIEITDDGYAVLQFGGGCNGCSMVDVTLKDGVEKQLVSLFPNELKRCTRRHRTPTWWTFLLLRIEDEKGRIIRPFIF